MSTKENTTSLDKIISLIKLTTQNRKEAQLTLDSLDRHLHSLQEQARAALEGTGLKLTIAGEGNAVKELYSTTELTITDWWALMPGDIIQVKVSGQDEWEQAEVEYVEGKDYQGSIVIRTVDELSDSCVWVDEDYDDWEFVSRPSK